MKMTTDLDLLRDYARGSEKAFTELVARHLDLIYSAALRQVKSSQLAEDITQSVFTDLARNAQQLKPDTVLAAWLYQVTRRTALNVSRGEARRQAREQMAVELADMNATSSDWTQIEPWLDEAMETLDEPDRAAILLRYFENKNLRDVGKTLGVGEDAAQKRVSRAVERLREFFSKRNVTIGASGLVVLISTNAVHAAPIGLAAMISTAISLAGKVVQTSTAIAATKTIAMTTLQKTLITAAIVVATGVGIYHERRVLNLQKKMKTLREGQSPLTEQIQHLQYERKGSEQQLAVSREEIERLNRNSSELLKLRGEVGLLRRQLAEASNSKTPTIEQSPPAAPRAAWKLRELRKIEELHNVGNEVPEAAAESVLWAAQSQPTNLLNMVHLPPELLAQARDEGISDILAQQLASRLLLILRVATKGDSQQLWLDGGGVTDFTQEGANGTKTSYADVVDFHLSGRTKIDDPASENHTDLLFKKIDGEWKLVIPGVSPEIPKKIE
ncbi:MAG: sigma-70 family RNA polymerase sigma factor [Verrucomicrobiota bacterium]|nr:sigma-70 family RNA polymerase sigma factor [Verrucomicrobiota bacterium]